MPKKSEDIDTRRSASVPKVSIGLPVYNGGRFLRGALDSLLGQSFQDFELIIADNASTDLTPQIIEEYSARDSRIRSFRHSENHGVFWNINFVIEEATGKYFMIAGDDDVYATNYIEALIKIIEADEGIGLAYSNYAWLSESGEIQLSARLKIRLAPANSKLHNLLIYQLKGSCLPLMMGLFNREVMMASLPFQQEALAPMTGDVDNVFLTKILSQASVAFTGETVFYYRSKDRSSSFPADWPKSFVSQCIYMYRHRSRVHRLYEYIYLKAGFRALEKFVLVISNKVIKQMLFARYVLHRMKSFQG